MTGHEGEGRGNNWNLAEGRPLFAHRVAYTAVAVLLRAEVLAGGRSCNAT